VSEIEITDHALVRWLERVHGMDMEYFRRAILEEVAPFVIHGVTAVRKDGVHYCLIGNRVTTVRVDKRWKGGPKFYPAIRDKGDGENVRQQTQAE
jgi:hypothetical protein